MKRVILFFLMVILLSPGNADADSVQAFVDRNQAAPGDSISFRISIKAKDGEPDLSVVRDFKVISQGKSSRMQMANGRITREIDYNYLLLPLKEGDLHIPKIPVRVDGKTLYTQKILVKVLKPSPLEKENADVFVTVDLSEKNPYAGQQIVYTFKLHNAVQIVNAQFQKPDFGGFLADELEERNSYRTIINGREFMVTELTFILVPLNSGEKAITPATLQIGVVKKTRRRRSSGIDSFFGDSFFSRQEVETRILKTDPLRVDVKPLPAFEGPGSYSDLVGRFDITSTIGNTDLKAGESTTLTIIVQGQGNIMDARIPEIIVPESFKTYADNPEETIDKGRTGYSGKKVFRIALVPIKEGIFKLAPMRLAYFDVSTGRYVTKNTQSFQLNVTPSEAAINDPSVFHASKEPVNTAKEKVEFTGRDILPIKEGLDAIEPSGKMSVFWFLLFIIGPILLSMGINMGIKLAKKDTDPASVMIERAKKSLKDARGDLPEDRFISSLHRALVSAILARAEMVGESLTRSEAQSLLMSKGLDENEALEAATLLETIETTGYSGKTFGSAYRMDLLNRTRDMVRRLSR